MNSIFQILAGIASVIWTSSHSTSKIIDYAHEYLPVLPSEIPHILCGSLAVGAFYWARDETFKIITQVYAPAMFIKATLIPITIVPDANPLCTQLHPLNCLTRNDMLPSGHMLIAISAAMALKTYWAYTLATLGGIALVASRMHYTVDVTLSIWLCVLLKQNGMA